MSGKKEHCCTLYHVAIINLMFRLQVIGYPNLKLEIRSKKKIWGCLSEYFWKFSTMVFWFQNCSDHLWEKYVLKVSKFQNEFLKSSFLPKYEPKIVKHYRAEILTIFGSYFGRNDDFINWFWNLLTFSDNEKLLLNSRLTIKNLWDS